MRYSPQPSALYTAALVGALGACGPNDNVQPPSQLEQTVAHAQVNAGANKEKKLDLSTPEKAWEVYEKMCRERKWKDTGRVWDKSQRKERKETDAYMKSIVEQFNSKYGEGKWDLKIVKKIKKKDHLRCKVALYVNEKKSGDSEGFELKLIGSEYRLIGM